MIDINLSGVWRTCKAAIPHLIAGGRGGSIVLTSSVAGLRSYSGVSHYVSAKHGVVGLMKTLAQELAPHRIRVNTVNPTQVDTDMIQNESMYHLFCPDIETPTREDFGAASAATSCSRSTGSSRSTSATPCCSSRPTKPATSPAWPCQSTQAH